MFWQKVTVYLSMAGTACLMIVFNIIIRIMHYISPSFSKKQILRMGEKSTMTQNPNFKYEDWGLTFTSFNFIKTASRHMWLCLGQEAFVGREAPNSPVVTMDREKTSVCKFLKGALRWPKFRSRCVSIPNVFIFCRQQAAGAEFWQLHLTTVHVQT